MHLLVRTWRGLVAAWLGFSLSAGAQTLDPTFHLPAIYTEAVVQEAVPLPNGQVVVAGSFTQANGQPVAALARFDAAGTLDQVFQQHVAGATLRVEQLHPLPNGQLLVQGDYQAGATQRQYVFRLKADGTLDPTFTLTFPGPYPYPNVIQTLVQPDGRILVLGFLTGNTDSAELIRLLPDGSRDPSFQVTLEAFSQAGTYMVLQPDGKVLVGGTLRKVNGATSWWFTRLNSDGSTDPTYQLGISPGATSLAGTNALALDGNGSLLVGGSYANQVAGQPRAVFRLLGSGALDPTFTLDPSLTGRTCQQLVVQPSGAIVALFDSYTRTGGQDVPLPFSSQLVRLLPSGALDTSFQPGSADFALQQVRGLATGGLLTWGAICNFAGQRRTLALLQPDGGLNASFAPLLQQPGRVQQVVCQDDGKLLLAGTFNSIDGHLTDRVARLLPTGYPDLGFTWRQPASATWATTALATQADGRVLLAGSSTWSNLFTSTSATYQPLLTRLTTSGSTDASFTPALTLSPASNIGVRLLAVQPDGNVVVGGDFVDGAGRPNLTRLMSAGSVDNSFVPPAAQPVVYAGVLQANGSLVCLLAATAALERLLPTGQVDPTFTYTPPSSGLYSRLEHVYADPTTGGYVKSGVFSTTQVLARVTATGASASGFATPFQPITGPALPYSGVNAVVVQPDGKLLVGGYMQQSGSFGTPVTLLARLLPTGQLDASFSTTLLSPATQTSTWYGAVNALALQPDGAVVVGGYLLEVAGQPGAGIVRLLAPTALSALTRASAVAGALQAWPVPAQDVLHLSLQGAAHPQRVCLVNTLGETVRTQPVTAPELTLSTAGLARGLYVVRVEYATGVTARAILLD